MNEKVISIGSENVATVASLLEKQIQLEKGLVELDKKKDYTFTLNEKALSGEGTATSTNSLSPITYSEVRQLWMMRIANNLHKLSELGIRIEQQVEAEPLSEESIEIPAELSVA